MSGGMLIPKFLAQAPGRMVLPGLLQEVWHVLWESNIIDFEYFKFEVVYEIRCRCPGTLTAETTGKKLLEIREWEVIEF